MWCLAPSCGIFPDHLGWLVRLEARKCEIASLVVPEYTESAKSSGLRKMVFFAYWRFPYSSLKCPNHTAPDAPPGYVALYLSLFSFGKFLLSLNKFFLDVLEFFRCHISLFNPFGVICLSSLAMACRLYGGYGVIPIFCDVPKRHTSCFRLRRGVIFSEAILYLAGLASLWEESPLHPTIFVDGQDYLHYPGNRSVTFNVVPTSVTLSEGSLEEVMDPTIGGLKRKRSKDLGGRASAPIFVRRRFGLSGPLATFVEDADSDPFLLASEATRWVKYIPIKINVFNWHARLDRLPTRCNLLNRGVVLESSLCPKCGSVPKDAQHIFFSASWPNLCFFGYVVGGISIGVMLRLLVIGIHGSLRFVIDVLDLGALNYFFGISVTRDARGMFLSQKKYAMKLLEHAHTPNFNATRTPVDTKSKLGYDGDPDSTLYRSLASGLQCLTFTRPDISYALQQICLHMHDHREPHLTDLKRVLRYIRGTLDHGL
nr:ribonuclease H-like domain-containing protein [Tanacetum cinerariifolium]